jgi:hypothetical protein
MSVATGASTIPIPQSVSPGAAVDCRGMEWKTVSVEGTFVATIAIQCSSDVSNSPAASSWLTETSFSAAGSLSLQRPVAWIRANVTAYTSGTPVGRIVGIVRV